VEDFITSFEHLAFRTEGMSDAFFMNALSMVSRMKSDPRFSWPTLQLGWKLLNMLKRPNKLFFPITKNPLLFLSLDPLILTPCHSPQGPKLTRDEMVEHQLKGIFYNCDEKYFSGHKCKEQKLFMAISEDVPEEDVTVPLVEEASLPDATQEPRSSSLLTVVAPKILFIVAFPRKPIAIFVLSIIFKS
jgi:hypothetical protein